MTLVPDNHVMRPSSSHDRQTTPEAHQSQPAGTRQFLLRPSAHTISPEVLPVTTGQLSPSTPQPHTTGLLSTPTLTTTGQLAYPVPTSPVTTKLPMSGPNTTTRLPTLIPATSKRTERTHLGQLKTVRRQRPLVFVSVLLGSLIMMILVTLFVAPLDNGQNGQNGQHPETLAQTLGHFISTGSFGVVNPAQQIATPTATPALLTNEGYCGGTDIWGTCATASISTGSMGTGQLQAPIQGATITQAFGHPEYQAWCGCWKPHTGIDLAAPYETPVMAADSGQVIWVGWDWSGLGWAVKINHGHYIATIYGHLARFIVKVGQSVTKGQIIAYEGSTGASTGPHLHFMVLVNNVWVDPTLYVNLP